LKVISPDVTLPEIDERNDDIPGKVNVLNLCRDNERGFSHE
jgi:hypothetical protein